MKTEAEIHAEIERRAEEFSTYRSDKPHEGLNIHAFDQYVGFKHGATLGREIEREQVRELIAECWEAIRHCECRGAIGLEEPLTKYQAARGDDHE